MANVHHGNEPPETEKGTLHEGEQPAPDPSVQHGHRAALEFAVIAEDSAWDKLLVVAAAIGLLILIVFALAMLNARLPAA